MSRRVVDDCQNLTESYGELCVYCNKCGRFPTDPEEWKKQREEEANKFIVWAKEHNIDINQFPVL